jgi:hypothetical protein
MCHGVRKENKKERKWKGGTNEGIRSESQNLEETLR